MVEKTGRLDFVLFDQGRPDREKAESGWGAVFRRRLIDLPRPCGLACNAPGNANAQVQKDPSRGVFDDTVSLLR